MKEKTINGKPAEFYSEVQSNLVMNNGEVTLGTVKPQASADMFYSTPSDLPNEPRKVGQIHLHNQASDGKWGYKIGSSISGGGNFVGGPSFSDQNYAGTNTNGVRNVVVDSKNIYLINGNKEQMITIPRK